MTEDKRGIAVLFDMDGVIVDNNKYHKKAWREYGKKFGTDLTDEDFKKHIAGRTNRDILAFFLGRELSDEEVNRYGGEKEALYRRLYKPGIKLPEGLQEFLDSLRDQQVKAALASSAPRENIDFVFECLGIRRYFEAVVDESNVKNGKPDPEVYLNAAELLGQEPHRCVVIEDSIPGIIAGKRAGMKVVAVTTTHKKQELSDADMVIDSFRELDMEKLSAIFK